MSHLLSFVQWLNDTPLSVYLRESDWPFPIIETIHILGLGFSVGTIMWLDLRLLGLAMREAPVTDVIEQLEPWAIGGFAVMFVSGSLLILSEPLKCYNTVMAGKNGGRAFPDFVAGRGDRGTMDRLFLISAQLLAHSVSIDTERYAK
jgi:hypothetical protein